MISGKISPSAFNNVTVVSVFRSPSAALSRFLVCPLWGRAWWRWASIAPPNLWWYILDQIQYMNSITVVCCTILILTCFIYVTPQSVLVPEASEFSQWEPETVESGCPVTAVIPVWRNLTTLDMSHNCISSIDSSVVRHTPAKTCNISSFTQSSVSNYV